MIIDFLSYLFLVIVLFSIVIYWALNRNIKIQNVFLLSICYFFFAFGSIWLLFTILISTIFNYFSGILLERDDSLRSKKIFLSITIFLNLLYLGVFKYFNFFMDEINRVLSLVRLDLNPIILILILPIGISFYTLQVIAYNIEIYRGNIKATKSFVNFAIYVAYFPKLTAGPIESPSSLLTQIEDPKHLRKTDFSGGFSLILLGYFKKIVIADLIAHYIYLFYLRPQSYGPNTSKIIVILFAIQIYADFSAYTDIARGLSKFFGIELKINFNQPYLSTNIQDFWGRWHISLSEWFKDYLYIPLGGNRKKTSRTILNIIIVFLISGLWHGASLNFIIWGFLHGIFLSMYRVNSLIYDKWKKNHINPILAKNSWQKCFKYLKQFIGWFITFQFICFTWIFFRAPDYETAILIIEQVYSFQEEPNFYIWSNFYFNLLVFSVFFILLIDIAQYRCKTHDIFSKIHWSLRGFIFSFMIFLIFIYSNIYTSYQPFIYAGF